MPNDYYESSGAPATSSQGSSATMRAEFDAIKQAFDKLPAMAGNADLPVFVNAAANALVALTLAAARQKLGLAIGSDVQAYDADLAAIAALGSAADRLPYATGPQSWALTPITAAARALLDDADASTQLTTLGVSNFAKTLLDDVDAAAARTTLGLVIGTNVQAQDAELSAIAGLTSAADRLPYFTGAGTAALATFTAAGRALLDDANAAAQLTTLGVSAFIQTLLNDADAATARATLGLVIGTDVQAFDQDLAAIAALASAADKMPYATGAGAWALTDLTAAARTLLSAPSVSAMHTVLGVTPYAATLLDDATATGARITLGAASSAEVVTLTGNQTIDGVKTFTAAPISTSNAKAWALFDGTLTGTISSSIGFNIPTVTKNGTGDYTLNINSGVLADGVFVVAGSARASSGAALANVSRHPSQAPTATACRITVAETAIGAVDRQLISALIFALNL